jgi:hypothetical protein
MIKERSNVEEKKKLGTGRGGEEQEEMENTVMVF